MGAFTLESLVQEHSEPKEDVVIKPETLGRVEFVLEIFRGAGIMLGLGFLWALESVRNVFFRILDRLNVKPRPRRASAFPPGRPRKRTVA